MALKLYRQSLRPVRSIAKVFMQQLLYSMNVGVDDALFGLTDDEMQLPRNVHDFLQKELKPHVDKIDKQNGWDDMR